MAGKPLRGLFIAGTDTDVGKTYVGCLVARRLVEQGVRVGVYKPAASGCRLEAGQLVSDDACALWQAAGSPGELDRVCPQRFAAPLAPPAAARAAGRAVDARLLRSGLGYWIERSDLVIVEGAGGLLSPIGEADLVADLAADFRLPLLIVVRNAIGAINQALQTLHVAATYRRKLPAAGVVLNRPSPAADASAAGNASELARWTRVPVLADVPYGATEIDAGIDWLALAKVA